MKHNRRSVVTPFPEDPLLEMLSRGIQTFDLDLMCQALLAGADPHGLLPTLDHGNLEPLKLAMYSKSPGRLSMMRLLLYHGADPNRVITHERSAFGQACIGEHMATSFFLTNAKINTLERVDGVLPSVWIASYFLSPALMRLQELFEKNDWPAHPELARNHLWTAPDDNGDTALMMSRIRLTSLTWLLTHPDLQMTKHLEDRNKQGRTVLWKAVFDVNLDVVKVLLSHGARVDVIDYEGEDLVNLTERMLKHRAIPPTEAQRFRETIHAAVASHRAKNSIQDLLKEHCINTSPHQKNTNCK